ncbi:MAG: choice-of-anchor B family protein [Bacteroidia bacterium]|nr:choice-of-anchor B family protein [Bacteroidia bacterium]
MKKKLLFYFIVLLCFPGQKAFTQMPQALNMKLLAHWDNPAVTVDTSYSIGLRYNEVWGWVSPGNGREFAIIGSHMGTHIVDVTDNSHVYEAAYIPGRSANVINRDYKTYGNYLYAFADQKTGSVQVIDLSPLPDSVEVVYDDFLYGDYEKTDTLFDKAHTAFVDNNRMYIASPKHFSSAPVYGFALLDLSKPAFPIVKKAYDQLEFGRVHAMYIKDDTAYLNAGGRGVYIVDFKDYENPITLNQYQGYPYAGYNHTGWMSEKDKIYIMADETWGTPVKVLDMKDPTNPELLSYLNPFMVYDSNAVPHNQFFVDQYAINSYYYDGVQIFDLSDPKNPTLAGYFDTYPGENNRSFKGNWGVYPFLPSRKMLVSDMQTGLYVLEFAPFALPHNGNEISVYPNPAQSVIHIKVREKLTKPVFQLYDMTGRLVISHAFEEGNAYSWILPDVTEGLYFLEILDGTQRVYSQKLLIASKFK